MACPHTAGVVILMTEANPLMTVRDKMNVLKATSKDLGIKGFDYTYGHGRLSAKKAVETYLSGIVVQGRLLSDSNKPLIGKVTILGTDVSVESNKDGYFSFFLMKGTYQCKAESYGFDSRTIPLNLNESSSSTSIKFRLTPSQWFIVKGTVLSKVNNQPLKAQIKVSNTEIEAVTDNNEKYSLKLPRGTYTFLISAVAHSPMTSEKIAVTSNKNLNFTLNHVPPILLVDDDNGKKYEEFFIKALKSYGTGFDYHNRKTASLKLEEIAGYKTIIWCTGTNRTKTLESSDQKILVEYLETGGSLILTGEEIAYDLKYNRFLSDVLKSKYLGDVKELTALKAFSKTFAIKGGTGANNMRYPDEIELTNSSDDSVICKYKRGGTAAVHIKGKNGHIAFFCFGIESVAKDENRVHLIRKSIELFPKGNRHAVQRLNWMPVELKQSYFSYVLQNQMTAEQLADAVKSTGTEGKLRALKIIENYSKIE